MSAILTNNLKISNIPLITDGTNLYFNNERIINSVELAAVSGSISGGGASSLDDLTDVIITTPITDQVLTYNGSNWVNGSAISGGGATESYVQSYANSTSANSYIQSQNYANTVVTNTTGSLQTQITTISPFHVVFGVDSAATVTTGEKNAAITSKRAGTITGWSINANPATSATISIWKLNGNRPTIANVITADTGLNDKPRIVSAKYASSTNVSSWLDTSVTDGDVFVFNIDTNTSAYNITLTLDIE